MPSNSDLGNYRDSPPEDSDISQDDWDDLGYDAQYYHYNKDRQKQIRNNQQKRTKERNDIIEDYKSGKSCTSCGEDESRILEFHHTSNDKEFSIGNANNVGASNERLRAEMEKCVLVCPNCHRKHHLDILEIE